MEQAFFKTVAFFHLFLLLVSWSAFAESKIPEGSPSYGISVENDTLTSSANDLDKTAKEITNDNSISANPQVSVHNDHLTSTANGEFLVGPSEPGEHDVSD